MTDLFDKGDAASLLRDKTIILLGGSVIRGLYKDLVWLLNSNSLINSGILGMKGEDSFPDLNSDKVKMTFDQRSVKKKIFHKNNLDRLHNCGDCQDDFKGLNSGRCYSEVREYYKRETNTMIVFKFINRVSPPESQPWTEEIEIRLGQRKMDILLVGSSIWDIKRWGPYGCEEFLDNLDQFLFDLPSRCQVFWITTCPLAEETSAKGMSIPGLEQLHFLTRFHILEVNKASALKFREHGLQVIDLYMSLQSLISKRKEDGIHWTPEANRLMTNKILTHICLAYRRRLPGRLQSEALQRLIKITTVQNADVKHNRISERKFELKVQITRAKRESIESVVMTMHDKLRSRSIHEVLTSKMRRRVKLGELRSNKRNAPTLDLVKKRKAIDEIDGTYARDTSKRHCTEKPPESKRLSVLNMEPKAVNVNPFDLTSKSQPYTRHVKDKRKNKKVSKDQRHPLVQRNWSNPFNPFQLSQIKRNNPQHVTGHNMESKPLFVFGGGDASDHDAAQFDNDADHNFGANNPFPWTPEGLYSANSSDPAQTDNVAFHNISANNPFHWRPDGLRPYTNSNFFN